MDMPIILVNLRSIQTPAPPSATRVMSILLVTVSLITVMIMSNTYDETGTRYVSVKKKTEEKMIHSTTSMTIDRKLLTKLNDEYGGGIG
jgi:hypothetical protein